MKTRNTYRVIAAAIEAVDHRHGGQLHLTDEAADAALVAPGYDYWGRMVDELRVRAVDTAGAYEQQGLYPGLLLEVQDAISDAQDSLNVVRRARDVYENLHSS